MPYLKALLATVGMALLMMGLMAVGAIGCALWEEKFVVGVTVFFVLCGFVGLYMGFLSDFRRRPK